MIDRYEKAKIKFASMSKESLQKVLVSLSSELKNMEKHCEDLKDVENGLAFMTSVYGSGLNVINKKDSKMSEEIYLKAKAILGRVQNTRNHNYSENEIFFVIGYLELYSKIYEEQELIKRKII